jgi:hypothetical protein
MRKTVPSSTLLGRSWTIHSTLDGACVCVFFSHRNTKGNLLRNLLCFDTEREGKNFKGERGRESVCVFFFL